MDGKNFQILRALSSMFFSSMFSLSAFHVVNCSFLRFFYNVENKGVFSSSQEHHRINLSLMYAMTKMSSISDAFWFGRFREDFIDY